MKTFEPRSAAAPRIASFSGRSVLALLSRYCPLFLLLLVGSATAFSQGITGTIAGTITDANGSAIRGAYVTLHQTETNAVRRLETGDTGSYVVPLLPPGHYSVKIEASGFETFYRDDIVLTIDQVVRIDASLNVGAKTEVVRVRAETPVLQTDQSSVGMVLDSNSLQNTPLNGHLSLLGLMVLAPGVQNLATAQDTIPAFGVTLAIGTGRRNSYGGMTTTLDGGINEEVSLQRSEAEIPSIDALQEFKIITNGAPAEFGQAGQIIIATKSGSNNFHGELLEYNRSKGTGAKNYSFTPPASTAARAPYERNEYGGNFSGPIRIPHLYNGTDRSFFFTSYEGYHLTNSSNVSTVQPTLKQRAGDFSEFLAGGVCDSTTNKTGIKIKNPFTGATYTGNNMAADINPISSQLLSILYPTPTVGGCGVNTYETIDYTQAAQRFSMRLDHRLTDRDQLRATFLRAFYGPYPYGYIDSKQGGYSGEGEHNVNSILGWTHTFSPSLLLDTTASYLHLIVVRQPHVNNVDFGSIIPGLGAIQFGGAPAITIHQPSGTDITATGDSGGGHPGLEQDIQFTPSLTKLFPKHTIKTGFSVVWSDYYASTPVSTGSFTFGSGTSGYSGIPFADFMFGVPTTSVNGNPPTYAFRYVGSQYAAYVQDDWKVLPTLTLNYGLRYDLQWFQSDAYGHNSLYIPEKQKLVVFGNSIPSTAVSSYVTALASAGRLATSADAGMGSDPWSYLGRPKADFSPRIGFAYQPMNKTVVRGAFGIFYNLIPTQYINTEINNLPFTASVTYSNSATATSSGYFTLNNAFSATGKYSANPSVGAQAKVKTPYTETYNLTVERELGAGFNLRIGYVGQHNLKQNNVQGPGTTTMNLNVSANPLIYPSTSTAQATYNVQPFSAITLNAIPYFHSTMNSLQVGMHKQFTHDLMLNAEYQWTRILGVENIENPSGVNLNDSYGPISSTTPQVLNLNYTYALPIGKGQMLMRNANGILDRLFGGWEWSGVGTFQAGQPFSVMAATPTRAVGLSSASYRANVVPGVPLYPQHKNRAQWFNPNAFVDPGTYTGSDGNTYAALGTSGYMMLRGPGWWNVDMDLAKNIRWAERYAVQLRADSFNIFNHPNLGLPNATVPLSGTSSTLGTITTTSSTPVYEARTVEFGAKFNF